MKRHTVIRLFYFVIELLKLSATVEESMKAIKELLAEDDKRTQSVEVGYMIVIALQIESGSFEWVA